MFSRNNYRKPPWIRQEAITIYSISQWQEPEEYSQPPVFITQPRDQQNVQEGKTVLFEARLEPAGDSSMRIEWFKDGKPLEASQYRIPSRNIQTGEQKLHAIRELDESLGAQDSETVAAFQAQERKPCIALATCPSESLKSKRGTLVCTLLQPPINWVLQALRRACLASVRR